MDIQTRKLEFIKEFLKIQSEELLSSLEKILESNSNFTIKDDVTIINEIPEYQKNIVRERIAVYEKNPESALDFDEAIEEIESDL